MLLGNFSYALAALIADPARDAFSGFVTREQSLRGRTNGKVVVELCCELFGQSSD
jgi:hypothetical protein